MKFFNKTKETLLVKDAGGAVVIGPFLPGTAEKGPWYDVWELADQYREQWIDQKKIGVVE